MIICILAVSLFFLVCPTPLLIFRLNSIMQPGAFNTCVHWVYVIVWMRMCSPVHGLSRMLHCSLFDVLVRIDRQVPDRSPSTLFSLMSVRTPGQFSSVLPQVRILSSRQASAAVLPYYLISRHSKAKTRNAWHEHNPK
jgi:hypothetical protein